MNIDQINGKSLEKVLKLMQKYQVESLKLHPDGTIEITKKVHLAATKTARAPIVNRTPTIEELINATPGIAPPKVSDFTRYTAAHIIPQD